MRNDPNAVILNDRDDDGTPHWKWRETPGDIWSAESFPTRQEAWKARIVAIRMSLRALRERL